MPIRSIFVINQAGQCVDESGSSKGISNSADLAHLKEQRKWANCVVTSGKTARVEKYAPLKGKKLVVFTNSPESRFSLLQQQENLEFKRYKGAESLRQLERDYGNVLIEFGPFLLGAALNEAAVDEVQISITGDSTTYDEAVLAKLPFDLKGFVRQSELVAPTLRVVYFNRE